MALAAEEKKKAPGPAEPPAPTKAIPLERMVNAGQVLGEVAHVTLPDDQKVEEGSQDVKLWGLVAVKLSMGQWVVVENDAGSMYRIMRVARIHGNSASGLRALVLYDLVPPKFVDVANEAVVATGDWYWRWGGSHRRWMVITPGGTVRLEGIGSEHEARNICIAESGNPAAR